MKCSSIGKCKTPFVLLSASLMVILAGCTSFPAGDRSSQIDHVLTREGENRLMPEEVGGVAWESEVGGKPEPISGGVSVVYDEGIIAMDGYSGDELWRYSDSREEPDFFFSYKRDQVAIYPTQYPDGGNASRQGLLLDTRTGQAQGSIATKPTSASDGKGYPGRQFAAFGQGYRLAEWHDQLQVLSLENGDEAWRTRDSFACSSHSDLDPFIGDSLIAENMVLANFTCAEHVTAEGVRSGDDGKRSSGVLALDISDGSEVWRIEESGPEYVASASSNISLNSTGDFLLQNRSGVGADGSEEESRMVSLESGKEVFSDTRWLVDFDAQQEHAILYDQKDNAYLRISPDGAEQNRAEIADGCSVGPLEDDTISLKDGVLAVCSGTAGSMEAVHWSAWNDDDSSAEVDLGVEYEELTDIVAAPGAVVVAYERDGEPAGVVGLS